MSTATRQRRQARDLKRYPAILPTFSTYEGCPPYYDAPDEDEANREIAERFIYADKDWYDAIIEVLMEDDGLKDCLYQLGQTLDMESTGLGSFDSMRISRAIRDLIADAGVKVAPQQREAWDEAAAEHRAGV